MHDRTGDVRMKIFLARKMRTWGMGRTIGIVGHGGNGRFADEGASRVTMIPPPGHWRGRWEGLVVRGGGKDDCATEGVDVRNVEASTDNPPANLGTFSRRIRPSNRTAPGPRRARLLLIEDAIFLLPRRLTTLRVRGERETVGRPMDRLVNPPPPPPPPS